MEYLEGRNLAAWVQQRGPLSVELAVEFILQACEAIAEAHALGIVHRDLKPANLFCIRRADSMLSIKVLDFGISAAIWGSPCYMSPQQVQGAKDVDPRTDIWALGVILYELVTGRVPFGGDTVAELVLKIISTYPAAQRLPSRRIRRIRSA